MGPRQNQFRQMTPHVSSSTHPQMGKFQYRCCFLLSNVQSTTIERIIFYRFRWNWILHLKFSVCNRFHSLIFNIKTNTHTKKKLTFDNLKQTQNAKNI